MKKLKNLYYESVGDDLCAKEAFFASRGWLDQFIKRNCLSLRRRATTTQKDPSQVASKIVAYLLQDQQLSEKYKHDPTCIKNMRILKISIFMTDDPKTLP